MLLKLTIENYALIEKLDIDFHEGFSVITGETGAGKSILLGALSLLLGQRADTGVLLEKEKKCVIEGVFRTSAYGLDEFFSSNELDNDGDTILRREINPAGKSRAFINDTPVNLPLLKELGDKLVNIHSQHAVITLNDADFQLAVIDSYSGNHELLREYREKFRLSRKLSRELDELTDLQKKAAAELDYHQFLFNELDEARLTENEQEEAEQKLEFLNHAEEIKTNLLRAVNYLSEGEGNVIDGLNSAAGLIDHIRDWHPSLSELSQRLQSNLIDLRDITSELEHLDEDVMFEPSEAEQLSQRLDLIYRLQHKHNVKTVNELISIKNDLSGKIIESDSLSEKISELSEKISQINEECGNLAGKLTSKRTSVCKSIETKIAELLGKLGMPHARFAVEITRSVNPKSDGNDNVRFLFSANSGVGLNDVAKIASGGELSRLMLSIKSLVSSKNLLPTIIFDEIDNGVSGEVAGKVGQILQAMGKTMQVIAITHLPQIAGQGKNHYQVFKSQGNGVTRTRIKELIREERITEIAKMLSNEKVTDAALKTAQELLLN